MFFSPQTDEYLYFEFVSAFLLLLVVFSFKRSFYFLVSCFVDTSSTDHVFQQITDDHRGCAIITALTRMRKVMSPNCQSNIFCCCGY